MSSFINWHLVKRIDSFVGLPISLLLLGWARLRARLGGPRHPAMRATTPPATDVAPLRPHRILVIKFYGLGNIVMLLPVAGALLRAYPQAKIDFLTIEENRILIERSHAADRVISIDVDTLAGLFRSVLGVIRTMLRERYDVVIDFEQFAKISTILAFFSGAPERIGFNTDGQRRGWLFTTRVVYTDSEHMSRIFMRLLLPLGIDTQPWRLEIKTNAAEDAAVSRFLSENGIERDRFPLIAVHAGSGPNFYRTPLKRWPPRHFAELCDQLVERHDAAIVLTGRGPEEQRLVDEIIGEMKHRAIDACDRLSLMELIVLLRRAHIVVSNDTSVIHLAAAVRTPVVAFFGPTAPLHYGPGNPEDLTFYKELYCSPCLTNYNLKVSRCGSPVCIQTISVAEVLRGIEARYLAPGAPLRTEIQRHGVASEAF